MHVKNTVVIKGAGYFVGAVEGKDYDNGQIFIEEPFDASKQTYKGFRTVEYKCVDSSIVKPVMHLPFPITAEVTMEISATKREGVIVVTGIRPLAAAANTPSANSSQAKAAA
ncbi:MAG: hypothetical protein V4614_11120 [Pseudomonadota bacterium]